MTSTVRSAPAHRGYINGRASSGPLCLASFCISSPDSTSSSSSRSCRVFKDLRSGKFDNDELDEQLNKRGLMNRLLGGFARKIDTSWKMYPVGLLFGLGFDTATEVALLVLSGTAVASGLPFYAILSLPVLFAAGMCLFDTLDGCFMNFAYGWAFSKPIRKVYYNIIITGLSVAVAFVIGTIELVGLLSSEFHLRGTFWKTMANFNINRAGFIIVAIFIVTWLVALAIWRFGHIETRWDGSADLNGADSVAGLVMEADLESLDA